MNAEEWRPVAGFADYEVSDLGRVRSRSRKRSPRVLACPPGTRGYRKVTLRREGKNFTRHVHVLVCEAFHGPRPDGQMVRHLDGNQLNNAASNLAWGSAVENAADMKRHGTNHNANKTHCSKGHPYAEWNTYIYGGHRHCKTCAIDRVYARRESDRLRRALAGSHPTKRRRPCIPAKEWDGATQPERYRNA